MFCRDTAAAWTLLNPIIQSAGLQRWLFFKGREMNIKTILHPTDFSAASRYALELAFSLARDHGARVVLLHVVEPQFYGGEPTMPVVTFEDLRAEAQNWFATLPKPRGDIPTIEIIAEGEPVGQILRVAAEEQADFIVLGTHGRTGLSRLLMGSVAETIIRRAQCPVLAVKTPTRPPAEENPEDQPSEEKAEATTR
jgi:nucleotide-binding universal stress UspA family protein